MIIEKATVIDYQNGIARVQCYAKQGCGSCSARSSCGTTALSGLAGKKVAPILEINVNEKLEIGDHIQLGLTETTLLKSVFLVYGIPLIILLLSAVIFSQLTNNELSIAIAIFFSTACSFAIVKKIIAHQQLTEFTPIFLGKLEK